MRLIQKRDSIISVVIVHILAQLPYRSWARIVFHDTGSRHREAKDIMQSAVRHVTGNSYPRATINCVIYSKNGKYDEISDRA